MTLRSLPILVLFAALAGKSGAETPSVPTFAGNAQHTAVYEAVAQNLNAIRWSTPINLSGAGYGHFGSPLITPANTIVVPVKTATNGFQLKALDATDGSAKYSLTTDYVLPSHNLAPVYQPVLATSAVGTRLYYPGAGGTVYFIDGPDSISHSAPVQQVFYTTLANYQASAAGFNSTVFINTPLTADGNGNIFFGFRVEGTAPAPLSTTQSGFARIDPSGNATYVLAGTAAGDAEIARDTHNSAPALSNDQTTVYVAVKSASTESYGYLLGLDATTLATRFKAFLRDPRNSRINNATILDDSTSSPMVAPDDDVYLGIYSNPGNRRGFLLRFSGDLTVEKTPGGFGWDYTPAVVPASMAPVYTGASPYLIFTKYNDYADFGNDGGKGVNRIALLDPNATEIDPHPGSNGLSIMREVVTVIGPTADAEHRSASLPDAVREWCINTAAVNPATYSIFAPSEDGHVYRWNLAQNSLSQLVALTSGLSGTYVPTVIGPDGTVYTLNGGSLLALGSLDGGVSITLSSSAPDVRYGVSGQPLTFTATVADTTGNRPTGTITFEDTVYFVPSPDVLDSTTTVLAANVPLDGEGRASYTTSALGADNHFITARYSGDAHFGAGSAARIQRAHASATVTTPAATPNPSNAGQAVTFRATVAAVVLPGSGPGSGIPTGFVSFQEGEAVLAQVPLGASGTASFTTSALALGNHTITAVYASDNLFAASGGGMTQVVQSANATTTTVSSTPNPSAFGRPVTFTATVASGAGVPTGTVAFTEGTTTLASGIAVDGTGHASFSIATLAAGSHVVTATFTGAAGWASSSGSDAPQIVLAAPTVKTFTSIAAQDGWVLESGETSNAGGSLNATARAAGALLVGDDGANRQYKAVVSFDTSAIPDGATILSATLRLHRGAVSGTNPFTTHGTCWVDVRTGGFSGSAALQTSDFQAPATVARAASLSNAAANGAWSEGSLNAAGLAAINKAGVTQLRVYFSLDDDNDRRADSIGYDSGDNRTAANRPQLVVTYQ